MNKDFSDQQNFFNPTKWNLPIHLIGAGGVNNLVGVALAKMGVGELHIWDDDHLEVRNCPTEIAYSYRSVGAFKTAAMASTIRFLIPGDGIIIHQHQERVSINTHPELDGVVICGVDSMKSRQEIWQVVEVQAEQIPFFIDARSGGKSAQIFAFRPDDAEKVTLYKSWLFDDERTKKLGCGARNYPPMSLLISAIITDLIAKFSNSAEIEFFRSPKFFEEEVNERWQKR